jgi:hypothetical protein
MADRHDHVEVDVDREMPGEGPLDQPPIAGSADPLGVAYIPHQAQVSPAEGIVATKRADPRLGLTSVTFALLRCW